MNRTDTSGNNDIYQLVYAYTHAMHRIQEHTVREKQHISSKRARGRGYFVQFANGKLLVCSFHFIHQPCLQNEILFPMGRVLIRTMHYSCTIF